MARVRHTHRPSATTHLSTARLLTLQPAAAFEVDVGEYGRHDHRCDCDRIAEGPGEFGHHVEVHAVDAGDQRRRHHSDGRDGEDLDDLVLFDVDETLRALQQEVHFLEQEVVVRQQRVDVADQIAQPLCVGFRLARVFDHGVAQQIGQVAAGVHQAQPDFAVQV